jgi:hypothetical protein
MGLRGGGGNHRLVQCGKRLEWSAQAIEKRQVCNINRFKCCSLLLVVYVHSIYSTGNSIDSCVWQLSDRTGYGAGLQFPLRLGSVMQC